MEIAETLVRSNAVDLVVIDSVAALTPRALIEAAVTPRTKAILVVHQIGMPCDLAGVLALAKKLKLPVVEDAACAVGAEIKMNGQWEKIGKPQGDIACFSFHRCRCGLGRLL